jgi:transcriptional regulator with AAA-type ATPase domain
MTKFEATNRVRRKLNFETQETVCKCLGITRPTLATRLQKNNWKISEIYAIEKL